jgi:hypothetical protein
MHLVIGWTVRPVKQKDRADELGVNEGLKDFHQEVVVLGWRGDHHTSKTAECDGQ